MPGGQLLFRTFDAVGNLVAETDPLGRESTSVYDTLNRRVRSTDPAPFRYTTTTTYDAVGNVLQATDRRGKTTDFLYDDLNRLLQRTDPTVDVVGDGIRLTQAYTYDAADNRLSMVDGRGIETTFRYDKENRATESKRADVVIETTEYDPVGNPRFVTDANGHTSGFVYDERGLVLEENRPESSVTRHQYDEQGNRIHSFDPSQRETRFTYDLRNRQRTVEIEVEPDRFAATTFTYDLNNQRLSVERPESGVQSFTYDDANRLRTVTATLLEAGGTLHTGTTTYTYDKNSNLRFVDDAEGRRTEFTYDELNRRTERIYPQTASQSEPSAESWTYDENSNIQTFTDAKGQVFQSTWDALNRERQRLYPAQDPAVLSDHLASMVMAYDGNHNLTQIDEQYSETGLRVTHRNHDDFDRLESIIDRWGQKLSYGYDANGNRTSLQAPSQSTSYTFDELNRLETVTTGGGLTTYDYHPNSRLKSVAYPNGTTAAYTFDTANRLKQIEQRYGELLIGSYDYQFDDNGNRIQQTELQYGRDTEITTYGYDLADRLESVVYPDQSVTYGYDSVGNRRTEAIIPATGDPFTKTYGYNPRDQLETITHSLDPAEHIAYTYDVNGNQLSKSKNGLVTAFTLNSRNQIARIEENGLPIGVYGYDHQGLRVRKYTDHETRYLYDDQSVLQRDDANDGTVYYEYGPDRLLSVKHPSEGRSFYLHDALGSVVAMTGPGASLLGQYSYDAWGNYRHRIENQSNVFGFTGHEMDGESGLVYAKARFYDPEVGRFLSHDPIEGDPNHPPSLHRYLYAYQNPTVFVDPDGRESADVQSRQLAYRQAGTESIEIDKAQARGAKLGLLSTAGLSWGLLKSGWDLAVGVATLPFNTVVEGNRAKKERTEAYLEGGNEARLSTLDRQVEQSKENSKETAANLIPLRHTLKEASQVPAAYEQGAFEGGAQAGKTTFSLAFDVAAVFGLGKAVKGARSGKVSGSATDEMSTAFADDLPPAANEVEVPRGAAPQVGGANLTIPGDKFGQFASKAIPEPGFTDVAIHGSKTGFAQASGGSGPDLSHRQVAKLLEGNLDYKGGPVRLVSCNTGACDATAAQNLANKLGVDVLAPDNIIWAYPDGRLFIGPRLVVDGKPTSFPDLSNPGEFKPFSPGGR